MTAASTTPNAPKGIDPRGPRVGAGITFFLALGSLILALVTPIGATAGARAVEPAFILLAITWIAFTFGTVGGVSRSPFSWLFRTLVRPRLAAPTELEDPRPPRFAQGIGFVLSTAGLVLHVLGVPSALAVAAGLIVIASFLNAFVGLCLGCQLYLLLVRAGILGRAAAA